MRSATKLPAAALAMALLSGMGAEARATTVVDLDLADVHTLHSNPASNFQSSTSVLISGSTSNLGLQARAYFLPDLSSITAATVTNASLSLTFKGGWNGQSNVLNPYAVQAYAITGAWSPSTITWNTNPTLGPTAVSTVQVPQALAIITSQNTEPTFTWDLTTLVNGWLSGALENRGVALVVASESVNQGNEYYSLESNVIGKMPLFRVTYEAALPVPEPATLGLATLSLGALASSLRSRRSSRRC